MIYGPLFGPFAGTQDIRCRDCKHWNPDGDDHDVVDGEVPEGTMHRLCVLFPPFAAGGTRVGAGPFVMHPPDGNGRLWTPPGFGCVLAEVKEKAR